MLAALYNWSVWGLFCLFVLFFDNTLPSYSDKQGKMFNVSYDLAKNITYYY